MPLPRLGRYSTALMYLTPRELFARIYIRCHYRRILELCHEKNILIW